MKFQLLGDWPATGNLCVPAGTEIDGHDPKWCGVPLPLPMPLNAKAMDQEAYDALVDWYYPTNDQVLRLLHYAPGVQPKKEN
jgi:hypothetical protein